jgi:hypothetical protein
MFNHCLELLLFKESLTCIPFRQTSDVGNSLHQPVFLSEFECLA